jgi:hypothetical protein
MGLVVRTTALKNSNSVWFEFYEIRTTHHTILWCHNIRTTTTKTTHKTKKGLLISIEIEIAPTAISRG